jgi:hypothetical protein
MLLPAAAASAVWALYDRTGIRPEWLLPTLYIESGFNPALPNAAGAPYYGIGQNGAGDLAAAGAESPAEYLTWSAADQIARVVQPYFARLVKTAGPLRSGTRVYQANYLPGTLGTVRLLIQVLAWKGSTFYDQNAILDATRDGAITLSDIALDVARAASAAEVRAALATCYALRPTERMQSPVYGADFLDPLWWLLAPSSTAAYALGAWAR